MFGHSRKGRRAKATRPRAMSSCDYTDAKTRRVTEMSERITGRPAAGTGFQQRMQGLSTIVHGLDGDWLPGRACRAPWVTTSPRLDTLISASPGRRVPLCTLRRMTLLPLSSSITISDRSSPRGTSAPPG